MMINHPTRHKIFEARQAREEAARDLRHKLGYIPEESIGALSLRRHPYHLRGDGEVFWAFSNAAGALDTAREYGRNVTDGFEGKKRAWALTNTITGESVSSESKPSELREFQEGKSNGMEIN